jgi:hypothetical protein
MLMKFYNSAVDPESITFWCYGANN